MYARQQDKIETLVCLETAASVFKSEEAIADCAG